MRLGCCDHVCERIPLALVRGGLASAAHRLLWKRRRLQQRRPATDAPAHARPRLPRTASVIITTTATATTAATAIATGITAAAAAVSTPATASAPGPGLLRPACTARLPPLQPPHLHPQQPVSVVL